MNLREIGCSSVDWTDLAQDRNQRRVLVNTVIKLWVFIKCWEVLE
jgi:hypothetical protein